MSDDLRATEHELVLNLWAEGKVQGEIVAAVDGLTLARFKNIICLARYYKDPRAVRRFDKASSRVEHESVIQAYALGLSPDEIAKAKYLPISTINWILESGRLRGDARAAKRQVIEDEPLPPRETSFPAEVRDVYTTEPTVFGAPRQVTVRAVSITAPKPVDALRPMKMSVAAHQSGDVSMTASLMGDPEPGRSVLGRECRADEYASGKGEGRHRGGEFTPYAMTTAPSRGAHR